MSQRWEIDFLGFPHVVELGDARKGPPAGFSSDGTQYRFPGGFRRGPRVVTFEIAGHPASVTRRAVMPGFWARFKRALSGDLQRGPAGAAASLLISWVHELVIDGTSRGSWVMTTVGGKLRSWVFVEPGDPIPAPSPSVPVERLPGSHDAPDLEGFLPKTVKGRELAIWSVRGEAVLRLWNLSPDLIARTSHDLEALGVRLGDLAQATAGRSDTHRDPPSLVFVFRIPPTGADLLGGYAMRAAGFTREMRTGDLVEQVIGGKHVSVGPVALIRQDRHERGRPYVYQPRDLVVVVVSDDEAWAADAIGQLP